MFNMHESSDILLDEVDTPDLDLDDQLEEDEDQLDSKNPDAGGLEKEFE